MVEQAFDRGGALLDGCALAVGQGDRRQHSPQVTVGLHDLGA
jgi:hypothetical protein